VPLVRAPRRPGAARKRACPARAARAYFCAT
jgi:hypothetical protein